MSTPKSKLWYLENVSLFDQLSPKELDMVQNKMVMKTISKGQYIYFPEDPSNSFFVLKEGTVKIGAFSSDGKEIIKTILQPGEIFGELSVAGEHKRRDFAQVTTKTAIICTMTREEMKEMMRMNPKLNLKVTKLIGFRLRKTETRLESLIFKDTKTRIIDFIKTMAKERGKVLGNGEILVKHHLTHQEIANLTATSRQTTTTVLNELAKKNQIFLERKSILVRNLNELG